MAWIYCSDCGYQESQHPDDEQAVREGRLVYDRHFHYTEEGMCICSKCWDNKDCGECYPKKPIKTDDIVQFVADMITCSPADVMREFDMTIDAARMRMKRLSDKGYFDRDQIGFRSFYTIKNVDVPRVVSAKAVLKRIVDYMVKTNHPKLKLVPIAQGGTNSGGGYTYQWRVLLEIMQGMEKDELYNIPTAKTCDICGHPHSSDCPL